jgi:hypothetical protein
MADITQNPDYKLVMTFLQNIRPGDMDQESAEQLMAIGQRIQNGGTLTEREREMLNSVVRAMPQMPMDPGSAVREGEMPRCQWTPGQRFVGARCQWHRCQWTPGRRFVGARCQWHRCQWTPDQRLANLNCQVLMA